MICAQESEPPVHPSSIIIIHTDMGVGVGPVLLYVSVEFEVIGQVQGGTLKFGDTIN